MNGGKETDGDVGVEINEEQLTSIIDMIREAQSKNRNRRRKVVKWVLELLDQLLPTMEDEVDQAKSQKVVVHLENIRVMIVEFFKLVLPLIEQCGQSDLAEECSKFSSHVCAVVDHLMSWSTIIEENTGRNASTHFFKMTTEIMTDFVRVLGKSESWRPADILYIPITKILINWEDAFSIECEAPIINWSTNVALQMRLLNKIVMGFGDFSGQYVTLILIQMWMRWVGKSEAENFVGRAFKTISNEAKEILLRNIDDDCDKTARLFLDKINVPSGHTRVRSIPCLYVFAGQEELHRTEGSDEFWVDFSFTSKRIHSFITFEENPWISFTLNEEHIDSVCISWIRRTEAEHQSMRCESVTETGTQMSRYGTTNTNDAFLICLHIKLKVPLDKISHELKSFEDKHATSLVLVFQDAAAIEKVLQQMGFAIHTNGDTCTNPSKLIREIQDDVETTDDEEMWYPKTTSYQSSLWDESIMEDPIPRSARNSKSSSISDNYVANLANSTFNENTSGSRTKIYTSTPLSHLGPVSDFNFSDDDNCSPTTANLQQSSRVTPVPSPKKVDSSSPSTIRLVSSSRSAPHEKSYDSNIFLYTSDEEQSKEEPPKPKTKRSSLQPRLAKPKRKAEPRINVVQTSLNVRFVETNPVQKVVGRTPCYRRFEESTDEPASQFHDPYDIRRYPDFITEQKMKTYSRKRKPKPQPTKPTKEKSQVKQQESKKQKGIGFAPKASPSKKLPSNLLAKKSKKEESVEKLPIVFAPKAPQLNTQSSNNLDETFDWEQDFDFRF